MDHAVEGLRRHPLQRACADHTRTNAARLHPVWTFSTGVLGGHEGQPLVVDNTMYVVTPWPNVLYAFDLSKEGYPLRWKYRPRREPECARRRLLRHRSIAAPSTPTARSSTTCSTDTRSRSMPRRAGSCGRRRSPTSAEGETTPMAPLVVEGPRDRRRLRRRVRHLRLGEGARPANRARSSGPARNIGPDADMLVQPGTFKPLYDRGADAGTAQLGRTTAGRPAARRCGAGCPTTRSSTSVYYGTGNPSPYNAEQRVGRQQVDRERAGAAPGGRLARVGVSVHAARQLGLRRDRRDGPRRPEGRRARPQGAGALRQERLRVHAGPRDRASCCSPRRSCT